MGNLKSVGFEGCFIFRDINEVIGLSGLAFRNISLDLDLFNDIGVGLLGLLFFITLIMYFQIIKIFIENHDGYFLMNFQD